MSRRTNRKTKGTFPVMLTTPLTEVFVPVKDDRGLWFNAVETIPDPKTPVNKIRADSWIRYFTDHGFQTVSDRIYYPTGFAPREEIWMRDDRGRMVNVNVYTGRDSKNMIESSIEYSDAPFSIAKPEEHSALAAGHDKTFEGKPLTIYDTFSMGMLAPYGERSNLKFFRQVGTMRKWVESQ